MSSQIKPITFVNRKGIKLFGIIHTPPQPRRDVGIIILSPGIKNRVAPHRLYVKMARRFCEMGFQVLRFDPEGLGDSEGEINERFTADLYGSIQVGRFIQDTICAMNWMEKEHKVTRFILSGLCGGAITALHAGAKDKRVDSILGLGLPVILDGSSIDRRKYLTGEEWVHTRKKYFKKVLDPRAWLRFFSLKSDYRLMLSSILQAVSKKGRNSQNKLNGEAPPANKQENCSKTNFNPYFPKIFRQFTSSKIIFLIFSGADKLYWEFEEKYMTQYKDEFKPHKENIQVYIVEDANHIFSFKEWQEIMMTRACGWLKVNY